MAKAKNSKVRKPAPDFNKGKLHDAIVKDVTARNNAAGTFRDTWLNYVGLCRDSTTNFTPQHAESLLLAINAEIVKQRRANNDFRVPALPSKPKINETKTILGMSKWACYRNVFASLKGLDVSEGGRGLNHGSLVIVARQLKKLGKGGKQYDTATETAPPRDKLLRAIEKRAEKRDGKSAARKPGSKVIKDDYAKVVADIKLRIGALNKWFGKNKNGAARFFDTATKAIDAIADAAKAHAKKMEEAKAEA